jgi:AsmA protein
MGKSIMPKVYKWLAIVLGGLFLFVVALILFVRFYLTGELLAAWLRPPLEHYLHRNVALTDASIGFRGFKLEGLEIRRQGASVPLLKGEKLHLRWRFTELLKGRIVIHTLAFSRPEITLIRQEDGSLNISDLLPEKTSSEPATPSGKKAKSAPTGVHLLISLLSMENGRLTFLDRSRQPQATLKVTNIQSRITDFSTSAPIPYQIEGQIEEGGKGSFTINGTYDLTKNALAGNANLKEIDLVHLTPLVAKEHPEIIQHGKLTMEASLTAEGFDHLMGTGSLKLGGLKIRIGEEISETLHVEASFQMDAVSSQQTLKIDALNLVLNGQKAQVQGLLTQWYQGPQLDFILTSHQIRLDELLALLPEAQLPADTTETTPEQEPGKTESAADKPEQQAGTESASPSAKTELLKQSEKSSDNPQTVSASATDTDQAAEKVSEKVAAAGEAAVKPEPATIDLETKPIPLELQGKIHLDWFFYNKLVASNVDCQLTFHEGKLQVKPLSASLYGGALGGNVKADVGSAGPPFQFSIYAENVLLDEIVKAFWPKTSGRWSGNVNQISKASGTGSNLSTLQARTDLNINEVEFSEHPLLVKLAELFQAEDLQRLRFSQVTARVLTSQGVATIKRLHLLGPVVQAEGSGTAGLLDKKLDLRLLLQIRAQYVGKIAPLREIVGKISDKQGFVRLPLTVSGTFDDPVYGLDERWLAKITKKAAKKPLKKLEKKILPKVPLTEKDKKKLTEDLQKLVE